MLLSGVTQSMVESYFCNMRLLTISILFLMSFSTQTQHWNSVLKDSPHRDENFSRALIALMSDAGHNFSSVPKKLESYHYLDTLWDVSSKLPGAKEAKLNMSNGSAILTETFAFTDTTGLDKLVQKVKATLPDDYVYSLDFDPASHTYDYTFEPNPMSKVKHIGYPNYFHITGDGETVFLFMGRSPSSLINPW